MTIVAGAVGATLAVGLFVLFRAERLGDSLDRARSEATFDLRLAESLLGSSDLQQAVESFEARGIRAVLIAGGGRFVSHPSAPSPIPRDLRTLVADGQLAYERLVVAGTPTLVVGGAVPARQAELYLFFPEGRIAGDLAQLRVVLALGWIAIVVIAYTLARAAEARIEGLAEAEAWGRRFTSDVSHELRTPVAALVSEAAVLSENLDRIPAESRRAAELLIADVARLRRLVEDLTSLAGLDAGREEVRSEPFDLVALIAGAVRSRGWSGRVTIHPERAALVSDRSRVDRVVANLIENALEHGGGDAEVRVRSGDEGITVEVADRGEGIAPADLDRVFDRFYRGDPARSGPGSGLGLAIARESARLLGGDVVVTSEVGVGSTFTLQLPRSAAARPTVAEP